MASHDVKDGVRNHGFEFEENENIGKKVLLKTPNFSCEGELYRIDLKEESVVLKYVKPAGSNDIYEFMIFKKRNIRELWLIKNGRAVMIKILKTIFNNKYNKYIYNNVKKQSDSYNNNINGKAQSKEKNVNIVKTKKKKTYILGKRVNLKYLQLERKKILLHTKMDTVYMAEEYVIVPKKKVILKNIRCIGSAGNQESMEVDNISIIKELWVIENGRKIRDITSEIFNDNNNNIQLKEKPHPTKPPTHQYNNNNNNKYIYNIHTDSLSIRKE